MAATERPEGCGWIDYLRDRSEQQSRGSKVLVATQLFGASFITGTGGNGGTSDGGKWWHHLRPRRWHDTWLAHPLLR
jgi:hypothetical protein